jgi:uncharacterized protein
LTRAGKPKLDEGGRSPLHYAALENDVATAKRELAAGSDPSLPDERGWTPLHAAASSHALDVAQLLLDHGADVHARDAFGNTPLWRAAFESMGRGEMINLLLAHGSDAHVKNNTGKSPFDVAHTIANYDVKQFFPVS